jgi:hypothetical protein
MESGTVAALIFLTLALDVSDQLHTPAALPQGKENQDHSGNFVKTIICGSNWELYHDNSGVHSVA